ncbi:MAG: site-specific integrase [Elusimicrobiota bacterium]|nr:MAG: site-specific integrase [Elusimicrobiota bacterium]
MSKKVIDGAYEVDFTYNGQRYRGSLPCQTLIALISGRSTEDNTKNLGRAGAAGFSRFVDEYFMPQHSLVNKKPSAHYADVCSIVALKLFLGDTPLHEVTKNLREEFKQKRLSGKLSPRGIKCANNTVNRELSCLTQVLEYAVQVDYLKENTLTGLKRLPTIHRDMFWLTKEQFDGQLVPVATAYEAGRYRGLIEFAAYTGARRNEILLFHKDHVDWARGEIRLATLKKRRRAMAERFLSIKDIGPRLENLLRRMKPHPETGYFFATRDGKPWNEHYVNKVFIVLRKKANLTQYRFHDLRHTFAMHRVMTRITFRQLQIELGHSSPQSVQAYLDQATRFDPKESIFYVEAAAGPSFAISS